MRYLVLGLTATLLCCTAAFADSFDFAGGHVVTHRGGFQSLPMGTDNLDRKNKMTCLSDKGCSLVIQTQVNDAGEDDVVCTEVDGVAAAPPCTITGGGWATATFQGAPALAKGVHTIQTHITVNEVAGSNIAGFQLVYTMYEHQ